MYNDYYVNKINTGNPHYNHEVETGVRTYSWTPKGVDKYVHERVN